MLVPMGLRLSEEKTRIVHIDEGFDFLGLPHPAADQARHRASVRLHLALEEGARLGQGQGEDDHPTGHATSRSPSSCASSTPVLRGWTNYFRHGVSKATFAYLRQFTWLRVVGWLRRKHRRANWEWLRRRYLATGGGPSTTAMALFDSEQCRSPATATAARRSPRHGARGPPPPRNPAARARGEPDAVEPARPVRGAGRRNPTRRNAGTAPRLDFAKRLLRLPGAGVTDVDVRRPGRTW